MNNNLPRGYVWLCIKDPTGLFVGGYFRWSDIKPLPRSDTPYWTDGTAFLNIETGTVLSVYENRLRKEANETRTLQTIKSF